MSDPDKASDRGKELDARLAEIRRRRAPKPRKAPGGKFAGAELAWRMVIELVAGIVIGAGMGWGLDSLFGSKPVFLILFILLGFGAGVRVMLQTAAGEERRQALRSAGDAKNASDEAKESASSGGRNTGAEAPQNEGR